jgi:hypothetical protein
MTEQEWLDCSDDPGKMLRTLRHRANDLKFRLFAVAHGRRRWDRLLDPRSRQAVEVAARFAEGRATEDELAAAHQAARLAHRDSIILQDFHRVARDGARPELAKSASAPDGELGHAVRGWMPRGDFPEPHELCPLVREVFGNPFRPVTIEPLWLAASDGAVRKLAQVIHDEAAFDRLPILADALEDAGCPDGDLLRHCREPDGHVRGCWAVDLLRGLDGTPSGPLRSEEEWLAPGQNLWRMLRFLEGKVSNRRLRLFAVACCRRIFPLIEGEASRAAVLVAERYADGQAGDEELRTAARRALAERQELARDANMYPVLRADACAFGCVAADDGVSRGLLVDRPSPLFDPDPGFQCLGVEAACRVLDHTTHSRAAARPFPRELLLDLFGNPFHVMAVGDVVRRRVAPLAQEIYQQRAFERLPNLADALEEAGCDDADILAHLRGPGQHARGCWALDAVRGVD